MTVSQSPFLKFRGFDNNGNPLSGGLLFTYAAGTTNKLATFTDSTGVTPNTNPVILDARGECDLFLTTGSLYKFVLSPSTDTDPPTNPFWTEDNISGLLSSVSSVSVIQTGTGAVSRSLQSKINDLFSTVDYDTLSHAKTAAGNSPVYDPVGIIYKDPSNNVDNVYGNADGAGRSALLIKTTDAGAHVGKEAYPLFIESRPLGTGNNSVTSIDYGLGISVLKQNWQTSTVIGQVCGVNVVVRGGYQGSFVNMNGDIAGFISNVVTSSPDYAASWESICAHEPGAGAIDQQIRTQIGVINVQNTNYIGYYGLKEVGTGGDGVLLANTAGVGNWTNYLRGVRDGADNFVISLAGTIRQFPVGLSVNTTTIENSGGVWHVLNNGGSEVLGVDQSGNMRAGNFVLTPIAYSPSIAPNGGAFTASIVNAYYVRHGSLIHADVYYNISAAGSAFGSLNIGLPTTATARAIISGSGSITGGKSLQAQFAGGSATVAIFNVYDGTTPCTTVGNGHVSFYYEST